MRKSSMDMLNRIAVDMKSGNVSYPKLEGFVLDVEKVYRTTELFMPHCSNAEQAIKLAVHQQLAAFQGAAQLRTGGSK